MPRYIDADALMKEFRDFVRDSNNSDFAPVPNWNDAVSLVGSAPTADVVERKKGKWIIIDSDEEKYEDIKCHNCKMNFTGEILRERGGAMYNEEVASMERNREPINTKEPESVKAISEELMDIVTEEMSLIMDIEGFLIGHIDNTPEKERDPQSFAEHLGQIRDYTRSMIPALRRIQEALWK